MDGRDIATLPRAELRSSLTVIGQSPLLLELSLRENLDIEGIYGDAEIWAALDAANVSPPSVPPRELIAVAVPRAGRFAA